MGASPLGSRRLAAHPAAGRIPCAIGEELRLEFLGMVVDLT